MRNILKIKLLNSLTCTPFFITANEGYLYKVGCNNQTLNKVIENVSHKIQTVLKTFFIEKFVKA